MSCRKFINQVILYIIYSFTLICNENKLAKNVNVAKFSDSVYFYLQNV